MSAVWGIVNRLLNLLAGVFILAAIGFFLAENNFMPLAIYGVAVILILVLSSLFKMFSYLAKGDGGDDFLSLDSRPIITIIAGIIFWSATAFIVIGIYLPMIS